MLAIKERLVARADIRFVARLEEGAAHNSFI
jgi:hypothetical protein